jgi:hypothetical protein
MMHKFSFAGIHIGMITPEMKIEVCGGEHHEKREEA